MGWVGLEEAGREKGAGFSVHGWCGVCGKEGLVGG